MERTYNPCDDCGYSTSKQNQESGMCKICEFKKAQMASSYMGIAQAKFKAELDSYKNAEEQGLLLRLPCKEGTTVYEIVNNADACRDCPYYSDFYGMDAMCNKRKTEILFNPRYADNPLCENQFLEIIEFKTELDFIYRHRNDFGKTVFLTREEAESALAEKGE